MLFGSISPVRQYWKYLFFLCPTMEADMEALGASCSSNCSTQSCACFVLLWRLGLVGLDSALRFSQPFRTLPMKRCRIRKVNNKNRNRVCTCLGLFTVHSMTVTNATERGGWSPTRRFRKKLSNIVLRLLGPSLTTRTRRAGSLQEAHSFFKGHTRGLY